MAKRMIGVRRRIPAWLAILALALRLAWPTPTPALPDLNVAALFGEHALCLAGANEAPASHEPAPASDHGDHDGIGCCAWHFGSGLVPALGLRAAPVAVADCHAMAKAAAAALARRNSGPAQARAPPAAA